MLTSFNETIKQSKELFILQHHKKLPEIQPECWKTFNILSFGQISYVFTHLQRKNKKIIANEYKINENLLQSWVITLSFIRNIAAHHSQLWNKKLIKPVKIPNKLKKLNIEQHSVFAAILITAILIKAITPNSTWKIRLQELIVKSSNVNKEKMGLPKNWEQILNSI
jgi:abortive infection bacteriophage resistance protein